MVEILTQEEVDALLSTIGKQDEKPQEVIEKRKVPTSKKINVYNFRRPDRVSREQMRSLHFIHDRFSRNFSSSLSAYLRTISEVNLISVEQLSYGEFLLSLPDPTIFYAISMKPMEGNIALELNPSLVFPIIDKLLGGEGLPISEIRPVTDIEKSIFDGVVRLILEDLKDSWKQIVEVDMRVAAVETSPQLIQIVASNEVVVLVVFEIKINDAIGMMNLCIPSIILEPVSHRFNQEWYSGQKKALTVDIIKRLKKHALKMPVNIVVDSREDILTVEDLMEMKVGDIIPLEIPAQSKFYLKAGGINRFFGELGKVQNNKVAFKVDSPLIE